MVTASAKGKNPSFAGLLVLVTDDDAFTRRALRLLLEALDCRVIEAGNGIDALRTIAEAKPQLVLLDIRMPVLDGIGVLRELRAAPAFRDLPVMAISGDTDRAIVMKMIDLGLAGFLVKPLSREETTQRLQPVLAAVARGDAPVMRGARKTSGTRPLLVLADTDPTFTAFAKGLLEGSFEVRELQSGIAAHDVILSEQAAFALIGVGLPLLREEALAQRLAAEKVKTRLILLAGTERVPTETVSQFHGVVRKTFVPDAFLEELHRAGVSVQAQDHSLPGLVSTTLRPALISATQHSLGVLASRDVTVQESSGADSAHGDVDARITLESSSFAQSLLLQFSCSAETAESLGSQILGNVTALDAGARDAIGEVVSTIAGQLRTELNSRDFPFEIGFVTTAATDELSGPALSCSFGSEHGERFVLNVYVHERSAGCP